MEIILVYYLDVFSETKPARAIPPMEIVSGFKVKISNNTYILNIDVVETTKNNQHSLSYMSSNKQTRISWQNEHFLLINYTEDCGLAYVGTTKPLD